MILSSKSELNIPFKYIAYILEKNKESLNKLCLDVQLEESSMKHFTSIILNTVKLKHLHLTANTQVDTFLTT